MDRLNVFWILMAILISCPIFSADNHWLTYYEQSGYRETPRYEQTIAYIQRLARASKWLRYRSFGLSPQGRELPLVIVDRQGHFTPEKVHRSGNIVVLIQSGIHAGEIDGKDASLMLMREMVITKKLAHLLEHVTVLFIPIFNVDGHERFGPYNRINQNGPLEMGWRTTAQNLNLNRDFMKADAPEMQAWLKLFNQWLPDFLVDCHVTDGADFQYVLTYGLDTTPLIDSALAGWSKRKLEPFLQKTMLEDGFPIFPFAGFRDRLNPRRGLQTYPLSPRFSTGYGSVQNRIFLLVETHMLKDYRSRVTATYQFLIHLLEVLNQEAATLKQLNRRADETAQNLQNRFLPLAMKTDFSDSTWVDFLGFAFDTVKSEISGGTWIQYHHQPVTYHIPNFHRVTVTDSVEVPYAYLIPQEWQLQLERLALHGIQIHTLKRDTTLVVNSYRFESPKWRSEPYENHHPLTEVKIIPIQEKRKFPAGTRVVFTNQRTARVIVHLLEPGSSDSFLKWGMWDSIFERKEYAEDYVLEQLARDMMAQDSTLAQEFWQRVHNDPEFAASKWSRLYFFYQRSPYWDEKLNKYPVGKILHPVRLMIE